MNTMNHPIPLTDAIVARGQRAWGTIKKTAAEQRELWRQVGEALLVGRKMHKADQKFSQWCKEMGFGDMDRRDRAAAMWLSEHWAGVSRCDTTLSHPRRIKEWFDEQKTASTLPADLQEVSIETKKVPTVDQKTAEKVAKLVRRAESQDEGSEIAKRHLEAVAKKHEVSVEALVGRSRDDGPRDLLPVLPATDRTDRGDRGERHGDRGRDGTGRPVPRGHRQGVHQGFPTDHGRRFQVSTQKKQKAFGKIKKDLLGYSEEAKKVDNLTMALRHRAGVHHYNKVEIASVARKWASIVQQLGTGRHPSRTRRRWSTVSPRPAHPL